MDADGFRALMTEQRARAKADAKARKTGRADLSAYRLITCGPHRGERRPVVFSPEMTG